MATSNGSRDLIAPILLVNLVMYLLVLGLAGWSIDKYIDRETHHHLGGNMSTGYLLIFSLLAGTVGACSSLTGLLHVWAWREYSFASAFTSALVSWALTTLSFGLTCKHINLGNRGRRLRTLEAFIIILTSTQLMYLVLLLASINQGNRDHGADYGTPARETQKDRTTTSPPDAV